MSFKFQLQGYYSYYTNGLSEITGSWNVDVEVKSSSARVSPCENTYFTIANFGKVAMNQGRWAVPRIWEKKETWFSPVACREELSSADSFILQQWDLFNTFELWNCEII